MFTGIITHMGELIKINHLGGDIEVHIKSDFATRHIAIGQSIACDGICLTVTKIVNDNNYKILIFFISKETISKTIAGIWQEKQLVNLEFALSNNSLFDGHMVTGHIDIRAIVKNIVKEENSYILEVFLVKEYLEYLISKGSITINGVSLTINNLDENSFSVNLIPHTWSNTNLQYLHKNDQVNIEVDVMAKYIKKYVNHEK
jgi:riboflavin synthase